MLGVDHCRYVTAVTGVSHPGGTFAGMSMEFSVGFLASGVLPRLPLLGVLIAGFVLIANRRAWLGPRSVLFARLGLGALAVTCLFQLATTMVMPMVYSSLDASVMGYSVLLSAVGLITSLLSAAGVGLLVAAVVTRGPGPSYVGQPYSDEPAG